MTKTKTDFWVHQARDWASDPAAEPFDLGEVSPRIMAAVMSARPTVFVMGSADDPIGLIFVTESGRIDEAVGRISHDQAGFELSLASAPSVARIAWQVAARTSWENRLKSAKREVTV